MPTLFPCNILAFLKTFHRRDAENAEKFIFIKSGDTDFIKEPAASGGIKVREAMSGFPLAVSPAKGKELFSASSASLR
jgi:hypothetical protein